MYNKFNSPDSVLVLTSFPESRTRVDNKGNFNAIGWHAERTIAQLADTHKVVVLAEKLTDKEQSPVEKSNSLLIRAWKKGSVFSIVSLFKYFRLLNRIKTVYVPFEFNIFGGTKPNIALTLLLLLARLTGKKIVFEFHQVILDIHSLKKHVNIVNPLLVAFFNLGLRLFYILVGLLADSIIVFEDDLKTRLSSFIRAKKINVLSLAVGKSAYISKKKAQKTLQLKPSDLNVLVFGFINGYKGIPWITEKLGNRKGIELIVAGGENPYLCTQPYYKRFYRETVALISKYTNVRHTGFVPDDEVATYFAAADVVVMPYEVFMSASGPFSLALTYKKPVLLSHTLEGYAGSADFAETLREAGLHKKDVFFRLNNNELTALLARYKRSARYSKKLHIFANSLAEKRSEKNNIAMLNELFFPTAQEKAEKAWRFSLLSS